MLCNLEAVSNFVIWNLCWHGCATVDNKRRGPLPTLFHFFAAVCMITHPLPCCRGLVSFVRVLVSPAPEGWRSHVLLSDQCLWWRRSNPPTRAHELLISNHCLSLLGHRWIDVHLRSHVRAGKDSTFGSVSKMVRSASRYVSERCQGTTGTRPSRRSIAACTSHMKHVASTRVSHDQDAVRIRPGTAADRRWICTMVMREKMNPIAPLSMDGFLLAVDANDERVGCLKVVHANEYVELSCLIVTPERRRQGVAKKLVRAAQMELPSNQAVYLTTIPRSLGFWQPFGFQVVPWQGAPLPLVAEAILGNLVSRVVVGEPCLLLSYQKSGVDGG